MTTPFVALLEYLGTFAFAISGGLVAVRHRLDLFGVLVLAFAAAAASGVTLSMTCFGAGLVPPANASNSLSALALGSVFSADETNI